MLTAATVPPVGSIAALPSIGSIAGSLDDLEAKCIKDRSTSSKEEIYFGKAAEFLVCWPFRPAGVGNVREKGHTGPSTFSRLPEADVVKAVL